MASARSLLVSGFDLREVILPGDSEVLLPPLPLPTVDQSHEAVATALDQPIAGAPLRRRVKPSSRVCIVVDDVTMPVPLSLRDCRRDMLESVLDALADLRVPPHRVTVLIGTGLSRHHRETELNDWLGLAVTSRVAVRCHDAEDEEGLVSLDDHSAGSFEVARAAIECDLLIHLNLVNTPVQVGTFSLVAGIAGARTARRLNAPELFEGDDAPLVAGSPWHQAHAHLGELLSAKVPVLQVSAVLNNELWPPAIASLLTQDHGLSRPSQMWNAMPYSVRHRAARLMRASFGPIGVFAGPPPAVAPQALELFLRQNEVAATGHADVLLFGLPDVGPFSLGSAQNPVLSAHLALGLVANLFTQAPLLKPGGILIFMNPLSGEFDARVHRPHFELYERVLRHERDSHEIAAHHEAALISRADLRTDYQQRFAFHPAHPFACWYQTEPARRRASRIIVAHGDPRVTARFGFMHAADVQQALEKAKEQLGASRLKVRVLELPPPFFVKVSEA